MLRITDSKLKITSKAPKSDGPIRSHNVRPLSSAGKIQSKPIGKDTITETPSKENPLRKKILQMMNDEGTSKNTSNNLNSCEAIKKHNGKPLSLVGSIQIQKKTGKQPEVRVFLNKSAEGKFFLHNKPIQGTPAPPKPQRTSRRPSSCKLRRKSKPKGRDTFIETPSEESLLKKRTLKMLNCALKADKIYSRGSIKGRNGRSLSSSSSQIRKDTNKPAELKVLFERRKSVTKVNNLEAGLKKVQINDLKKRYQTQPVVTHVDQDSFLWRRLSGPRERKRCTRTPKVNNQAQQRREKKTTKPKRKFK